MLGGASAGDDAVVILSPLAYNGAAVLQVASEGVQNDLRVFFCGLQHEKADAFIWSDAENFVLSHENPSCFNFKLLYGIRLYIVKLFYV